MSAYPHNDEPHYVYRYYDDEGRLLYVGCTYQPPVRMRQHSHLSPWFASATRVRHVVFPDRSTALAKEREAIETEAPIHNKVATVVVLRRIARESA